MPSEALIDALAVTAELCGTNLSDPAKRVLLQDLSPYPEGLVIGALASCRKQLRGRLTLSEIVSRIDDGRPSVEEAWAKIPRDEGCTVVWTEEMSAAFGVALPLLQHGDEVAARMAFKETYSRLVTKARDECLQVKWSVSIGSDKSGRKAAIEEAVQKGLIAREKAALYLPQDSASIESVLMLGCESGAIPKEKALELIAGLQKQFGL